MPDGPRFDSEAALRPLKDFQRRTVDYVMRRFYLDSDPTMRFLVADEVGLGKTMIARGVIACAIERLWDSVDRIDVLYICSNQAIAQPEYQSAECAWQGYLHVADTYDAPALGVR